MSRRLPSLNALRAFEAAARHLSFVRAADELHVTPAAISQQIKLLEDQLGVALFLRGKKLALSAAAGATLPLISAAFDQLERAVMQVKADEMAGTLLVSVPPAFAARWLIPRLDDFNSRHPEVELRLLATRKLVDFRVDDVDAAIRFGSGNYPDLQVERLMRETIVPVASPVLAQSIASAQALSRATLIEDEWHTTLGAFPDWGTWLASLGVESEAPLRIRRFGDANLTIQAAIAGMGVALAWHSLVVDDLKTGRLVRLLDRTIASELGYHLVIPHHRAGLTRVTAFRTWMLDQTSSPD